MKKSTSLLYSKSVFAAFAVTVALIEFSGCAKDRTADDYKAQQFQIQLAKIAAANGTYSGFAVSEADGVTKGPMQLTLNAQAQKVSSTDQSSASQQPVLNAEVVLMSGTEKMPLTAADSSFDRTTGVFKTSITVTRPEGGSSPKSYIVDINGVLHNDSGTFDGNIEVENYAGYGFKFHLVRGGQSLDQLSAQSTVRPNLVLSQGNFAGTTVFTADGTKKPVSLTLINPQTTTDNDFLTALLPVKVLTATLNYGDGALVSFSGAQWDQRSGLLNGQGNVLAGGTTGTSTQGSGSAPTTTTSAQNSTVVLNCYYVPKTQGFDCKHTSASATSTVIAETVVNPIQPGVQIDLSDDPANRKDVTHSYKGTAILPDPMHQNQTIKKDVIFTVEYPSRTHQQEIDDLFLPNAEEYVFVSFAFTDGIPGPSNSAKYDKAHGTIEGVATVSTPAGTGGYGSIKCANFKFADPATSKYSFDCTYLSTVNERPTTLKLSN